MAADETKEQETKENEEKETEESKEGAAADETKEQETEAAGPTKTKVKAPKGIGGFGFAGEFYSPNKKGIMEIPPEALADALIHGYEVVTEK